MLPIESSISMSSKPRESRFSKILKFTDKYMIQLIIILSLFSFFIASIILTILKIIFGKTKTTNKIYTKRAILFVITSSLFLLFAFEVETSSNYLVSYYDDNKYNYEPLKDNFQILMTYLLPWWTTAIETILQYIKIPGADAFAAAVILLFVLGIFKKIGTKDANMFIHVGIYEKIMAISRIIRVIAFSLVLVPNPQYNCYLEKFRIPENNTQMFWDIIKFRNAGCNDLIISGHTLFIWITFKFISGIAGRITAAYLKVLVPFILFNIIMMKNHYSVDVFFGVIIAEYVWGIVMERHRSFILEFTEEDGGQIEQNRIFKNIEKLNRLDMAHENELI